MTSIKTKICGIQTLDALKSCIDNGAQFVGLNFYPPSPRSVSVIVAAQLVAACPPHIKTVGVFVDPSSEELEHVLSEVALDMIQLHGKETPKMIENIRATYRLPVIKAIPLNDKNDLNHCAEYEDAADYMLFDSKPPKMVASLPGGTGLAFDWAILQGRTFKKPWFLAGGLKADNIAKAIQQSGAMMVDAASGIEDRPGHKNIEKIREFLEEIKKVG